MKLNQSEGEGLVQAARKSINFYLKTKTKFKMPVPDKYKKKQGVFVTLETYPNHALRGCVGYPRATQPLIEGVVDAAAQAAAHDMRFPRVKPEEMRDIVIEITVLTEPELIKVKDLKDYPKHIKVGKHGLIVEWRHFFGLLLPQVAVEQKWDSEEFLSNTCLKAGIDMTAWLSKEAKIYRFEGQVCAEEKPEGNVVERKL
jgi:uncharacterized protein (TIGR00296 family)